MPAAFTYRPFLSGRGPRFRLEWDADQRPRDLCETRADVA